MPDTRAHRGRHPEDAEAFAPPVHATLRAAHADLCWLLDRGYALRSSLALTGDHFQLTQRQRLAVARCACSAAQRDHRLARRVAPADLAGRELWIDGYNLLILLESALAGGVILAGRDGCYRDMASLHGTYREVEETLRAAELVGTALQTWGVARARWILDRPVGNSGRLQSLLLALAAERGWTWDISLEFSPDKLLREASAPVATSDSAVLDHCAHWCNAARAIIDSHSLPTLRVDLETPATSFSAD